MIVYLDRNYVGVFMLWDHLFGSFQEELDHEPCIYGIRGQLKSWNPVWANLHYYWAMAKDSWHASSWLDKLKVWVAPPGWRPADVAERFPKPEYDLGRDFERFDPARRAALSYYALVQFIALTASNSHFLAVLPVQSVASNLLYFVFIAVTLVVLGGVLENRREFLLLEAAAAGVHRRRSARGRLVVWRRPHRRARGGFRSAVAALSVVRLASASPANFFDGRTSTIRW